MKMLQIGMLATMMILSLPTLAFAHDWWLQPDSFQIGLNALLVARLLTGHRLKAQKELPLEKEMTPRLDLFSSAGRTDLLALSKEGQCPAIEYRTNFEGHGLLVTDRRFTEITLSADKFRGYLSSEHHLDLLTTRDDSGQRLEEKERYARCVKALVQVGSVSGSTFHDLVTGQKLEIILKTDPYRCRRGDTMEIRVLFDNRPLGNKSVRSYRCAPDGLVADATETTDANGTAFFNIDQPGLWVIRLIHLYPCSREYKMDWESYWASYCFEVPE